MRVSKPQQPCIPYLSPSFINPNSPLHVTHANPPSHPSPPQLFNATAAEDLIVKQDKRGKYVAGAVTNWTLVSLNHDTQVGGLEVLVLRVAATAGASSSKLAPGQLPTSPWCLPCVAARQALWQPARALCLLRYTCICLPSSSFSHTAQLWPLCPSSPPHRCAWTPM